MFLDDFFTACSSQRRAKEGLLTLIQLLRKLGFSIAYDKVEGPTQVLTFLGIQIDTRDMSLRLPPNKIKKLKAVLATFKHRKRASYRQLQQLTGRLCWAAHVVKGGRVYLQRCFDLMRPLQQPHHKVRLTEGFFGDIAWWDQCLDLFNKTSILKSSAAEHFVFTDACNVGGGMISGNDWAYIHWDNDQPNIAQDHINVKETMAIVHAVSRWAPLWANSHVLIHTDNIYARACINRGVCRNEKLMKYLRALFWIATKYNFTIKCRHIAGFANVEADSASRLHQRGHLMHWDSRVMSGLPFTLEQLSHQFVGHMSHNTWLYLFSQMCQLHRSCVNWTSSSYITAPGHLSHLRSYVKYCEATGDTSLPMSNQSVCRYAVYLAERLDYSSIPKYLNILRILHREFNLGRVHI